MRREQALNKACSLLREQAKEESLAKFLLMYLLDETTIEFNSKFFEKLDEEIIDTYFKLISTHINEDTPLSHLVGFEIFYDRKFIVTKDVLSPRMETEELVYEVIKYIKNNKLNNLKILDLCTGSGAIAITLKKELEQLNVNTEIVASDISFEALNIAKKNAENNLANINFIKSDIFDDINCKFDLIISNPPYISENEKNNIQKNVLNYDPHIALFAEENGLYFYRNIIENAKKYLQNDNSLIFFEIGYKQGNDIKKISIKNNFNIEIKKDINGRDRIAILKVN